MGCSCIWGWGTSEVEGRNLVGPSVCRGPTKVRFSVKEPTRQFTSLRQCSDQNMLSSTCTQCARTAGTLSATNKTHSCISANRLEYCFERQRPDEPSPPPATALLVVIMTLIKHKYNKKISFPLGLFCNQICIPNNLNHPSFRKLCLHVTWIIESL